MVLLLTVLSVLAVWSLLALLVLGLLVIFKALEAVRRNLEQIAMGVRAIEHETAPLGRDAAALGTNLHSAAAALDDLGARLEHTVQQLAAPAPARGSQR